MNDHIHIFPFAFLTFCFLFSNRKSCVEESASSTTTAPERCRQRRCGSTSMASPGTLSACLLSTMIWYIDDISMIYLWYIDGWAHTSILRIIDSELFPIGSRRSQMKVQRTVWILNKFEPKRNVDQISQNRKKNPSYEKKITKNPNLFL